MRYFDLHCDTVLECMEKNQSLLSNNLNLDVMRLSKFSRAAQVFALFVHDDFRGSDAEDRLLKLKDTYYKQTDEAGVKRCENYADLESAWESGRTAGILSIENGAALGGKLENIKKYYDFGVRAMTLTWNAANELAGGADSEDGLTAFGKRVLTDMEHIGMIPDVSHLNEKSFYDVMKVVTKPVMATHSNSFFACPHKRNLKDEQFLLICKTGGIVGINLHVDFLSLKNAGYSDVLRHINHFLSLDGENHLALGTDFDGAKMAKDWSGVEKMDRFFEKIEAEFGKETADKIFYKNACVFFAKVLTK